MRYRTKPLEIEAFPYKGLESLYELRQAFPDIEIERVDRGPVVWDYLQMTWVGINPGDYIIRGMKGEYYPCEAEVFETKYEAVE